MILTPSFSQVRWRMLTLALLCSALWAAPLWGKGIELDASRGSISIIAKIDAARLALSDELLLTWIIEGPAPLKVTLPKSVLDSDTAPFWRVKQDRLPERQPMPDGRERWTQRFRLSPFEAGRDVPIALAPFQLQAGSQLEIQVRWPKSAAVEVTTSITALNRDSLRPATEIEPLPPQPVPSDDVLGSLLFLLPAVVIFVSLVLLFRRLRRRYRPVHPVHDARWALDRLQGLAAPENSKDCASLPLLADILRQFLEYQFRIPCTRWSSPELLSQLHRLDYCYSWAKLGQILDACDRVKFGEKLPQPERTSQYEEFYPWAVQFVESFLAPNAESK